METSGFEADDLIGTLSRKAEEAGFSVVIVTGDKDFVQMVTDKTTIWDPMKDKTIDLQTVKESFGVAPSQIIDVMGLAGDASDNIPGVPGIGPKTALSLIKSFGSMDQVYEQVDQITKKKQQNNLVQFKEQALLSKELVTINTSVPISFNPETYKSVEPDHEKLAALFKELEFRQLQQVFSRQEGLSKKNYLPVLDMEMLALLIERLESAELFAIDTETTSRKPMLAKLVGLSFSLEPNEAFYIPCRHDYLGAPVQLELETVLDLLKPVLENPDIKKVGQNIKYDWMVLKHHEINLAGIFFDTMLASYLINPSKRAHSLSQIALDFLNHQMISYQEVAGKGKKALSFSKVPLDKAVPYACEDADITLMAYHALLPLL